DLAPDGHGDLLGQVPVGHRGGDRGDVADLGGEVGGHVVDAVGQVLPRAGHALHRRLATQLALRAHSPDHTRALAGEPASAVGDVRSLIPCTDRFRSRISPWTATVIFWDRSPRATAVVTEAMSRTWAVRLEAMKLTLSVRSFHVPATPSTWAWPPSLPSVPTSRATRVTSSAKARRVSVMRLMVSASTATSPLASTVIFWDRSHRGTAVATWAMLRAWLVRL